MIIIEIIGGLGNQMFEYAAAFVAAKYAHAELKLDTLYYNDKSKRYHRFEYRPYALNLFNLSASIASPEEIRRFTFPRIYNKYIYHFLRKLHKNKNVYTETDIKVFANLSRLPSDCYLKGCFQNYEYIKNDIDDIKKEFTFKDSLPERYHEMVSLIKNADNSICVVFRRGDYVGHPFLDIVDLDYYYHALQIMGIPNATIFVFSDDIDWCIQHFSPPSQHKVHFVSQEYTGPMGGHYLQLMMLCHHFIIPNSTYPFWAALLSETDMYKKVIAPKIWYKGQDPVIRNNILPDSWIAL